MDIRGAGELQSIKRAELQNDLNWIEIGISVRTIFDTVVNNPFILFFTYMNLVSSYNDAVFFCICSCICI